MKLIYLTIFNIKNHPRKASFYVKCVHKIDINFMLNRIRIIFSMVNEISEKYK